jgi:hypothetical protein
LAIVFSQDCDSKITVGRVHRDRRDIDRDNRDMIDAARRQAGRWSRAVATSGRRNRGCLMEMTIGVGCFGADAKYAKRDHEIFEHGEPPLAHHANAKGRLL